MFGKRKGNYGSSRSGKFGGENNQIRAGKQKGRKSSGISGFYLFFNSSERKFVRDSIYVGQLPADIQENDLRKLFPKTTNVQLTPAAGTRLGLMLCFI